MSPNHVLRPYLERYKKATIYTCEFRTMGIGESAVDVVLNDLISNQSNVSIALYASEEIVGFVYGCKADSSVEAEQMMAESKRIIIERFRLPISLLKEI